MRRKLGFWMATALVVGNIIGSAIFMLPAGLAPFGWNAVSAWMITVLGALSMAWVLAMLSRYLPHVGGSFGFMRLGVGEDAAFIGGWGYVVSGWAANAGIAIAGTSYLARLIPVLTEVPWASPLAALAAIWLFTAVNLRGLRTAGGVQTVTTVIKVLPFVLVIGLAVWRIIQGTAALPPVHGDSVSLRGTTGALGLTLYAMLGLESAAVPADAVEKPERNVPRATMIGTALSAVVTLIATCAVALMTDAGAAAASTAPVSDFVASAFGGAAGTLVAACAVISCLGSLNGWLLITGQVPLAMAKSGSLPPWFARVNARGVPARSIVLGALIASLLTVMAYTKVGVAAYTFAVLISTATNLPLYLLCLVAVVRFMRDQRVPRTKALWSSAAFAFVFVLWAFYSAGAEAIAWGVALTVAGWPIYRLNKRSPTVAEAA